MVVVKAVLEVVVMGGRGGVCEEAARAGGPGEGGGRRGNSRESWVVGAQDKVWGCARHGGRVGRGGVGNGEAARHPNKAQPDVHRE